MSIAQPLFSGFVYLKAPKGANPKKIHREIFSLAKAKESGLPATSTVVSLNGSVIGVSATASDDVMQKFARDVLSKIQGVAEAILVTEDKAAALAGQVELKTGKPGQPDYIMLDERGPTRLRKAFSNRTEALTRNWEAASGEKKISSSRVIATA